MAAYEAARDYDNAVRLYLDKLNDPEYLNFQMRCMLNEGECDEVGNLIKRKYLATFRMYRMNDYVWRKDNLKVNTKNYDNSIF